MVKNISYNLFEYLRTRLTGLTFIVSNWSIDTVDDSVLIRQTGGTPVHWYDRTDWTVQIMSRAHDATQAKKQIDQVYEELFNKFTLSLPSITVDGILYDAVRTAQISPIQAPGYIGADDRGLHMWSYNNIIITK